MYRPIPQTPSHLRVFNACLLSFMLLMAPLASVSAATRRAILLPATAKNHKATERAQPSLVELPAAVPAPAPVPAPPLAPIITATLDDGVAAGSFKRPGETITYTATITNTGPDPATNVVFSNDLTANPNLTFVPGSVQTQPLAIADTYNVIGNVRIQPNAAQGLLANDVDPDTGNNTGLNATVETKSSTQCTGGCSNNVSISADGTFTYNPPVGFAGTDTFTYTITDPTSKTDTATASLNVGNGTATPGTNVIWFVDDSAAAGGDGRLTSPFNCYTGTSNAGQTCFSDTAADDAGDFIFLFDGSYTGGYTLLNNEKLIGQDASASLASISGFTVQAYSDALPTTDATAGGVTITTAAAATNAINLAQGNLLRGFTVGNTTGAKINGNNFLTLAVGNNVTPDVVLNGAGKALDLTTGTFTATSAFSSVATTSSGDQGIELTGIAGTVLFGSTTVSGSTSQGILVGTTTANINFGNTSVTGGTDAISLQNNSSGTRTFGTITISGNTGVGFLHAVGGGAVTVTGATSITNPAGVGIDVDGSNANLSFAGTTVNKNATGNIGVDLTNNATRTITFSSLAVTTTNAFTLNANNSGTVNVTNAAGSSLTQSGAGGGAASLTNTALGLNFTSVSSNGGGNGIIFSGGSGMFASGTTNLQNNAGVGLLMSSSAVAANFGNTTVNSSAGDAVDLSSNTGAITFADLDLTPDANLRGLDASSNTGTISSTSGDISTTDAVAVNISSSLLNMTLTSVSADNTGTANSCVSLTSMTGTLTSNGGTLTGGTAAAFLASGGNGSSSYNGAITQNTAAQRAVDVQSKTGGTAAFGGLITASTTTANAIHLATNTSATINFTGGLSLTTTSGVGFNATGGGTVNATQNNSTIVNTISSGTGTALNIANTTIGASNLTFRSIAANGAANGIVLNTTGSSGGLTITGDSGSTNNNSGGTIQNTTSHGISLTSTQNVSLDQMNIQSTGGSGINGTAVTNFTFTNGTINNSGNAIGECNISFNGNGTLLGNNLNGTLTVMGSTLNNAFDHGIHVQNDSGTIINAVLQNNTITSSTSTATSKGTGIQLVGTGNATTVSNLTKATISNNTIRNFPSAHGIQVIYGNVSATGPAGISGAPGDATNIISITNNTVRGFDATNRLGGSTIVISTNGGNSSQRSLGNFNVSNNGTVAEPIGNSLGTVILIGNNGYATMTATVNNNVLVGNTTVASPGIGGGNGIVSSSAETPDLTLTASGNNISLTDGNGILLVGRGVSGIAKFSIKNNTVGAPLTGFRPGIRVDAGNNSSVDDAVCVDISGNTSGGSGGAPGIGIRKQGTVATTNDFGIEGLSPSPATYNQAEDYVSGLNPGSVLGTAADGGSKRTISFSGDNYVSCSSAPLLFSAGGISSYGSWQSAVLDSAGLSDKSANQCTNAVDEDSSTNPISLHAVATGESFGGSFPGRVSYSSINQEQLDLIVSAAIDRWSATGLTAQQMAFVHNLRFEIGDLRDSYLGEASGNRVLVDRDAQGKGWFVDDTPADDVEFADRTSATRSYTNPFTSAAGRIDLLTAIEHEIGHRLGLVDSYAEKDRDSIMYGYLTVGERRVPAKGQAANAQAGSLTGSHFLKLDKAEARGQRSGVRSHHAATSKLETRNSKLATAVATAAPLAGSFTVNIGTLPAGDSVTITFQVTIADTLSPAAANSVSNQATVTADGGINSLTDDPQTGTAGDATVTPIDKFEPSIDIQSSDTSTDEGESVTFIATLTHGTALVDPLPTGTVDFVDQTDANPLNWEVLCDDVALTVGALSSTSQCVTTGVDAGTRTIAAVYSGDGRYDPATDTVAQTVTACASNPVVTNTNDSGAGSLRDAIANICSAPNNNVTFDITGAGPHTITLTSGELAVAKDVVINNSSGERVTVSGNVAGRVFNINSGKTAAIIGLTIAGGNSAQNGGGILNEGTLTVVNSTLTGNLTAIDGGAISSSATSTSLTLINTTVSGNDASGFGGGVDVLGGTVTIINSTITGNRGDFDDNTTGGAGGVRRQGGTVTLHNTIVAGNFKGAATPVANDIEGTVEVASSNNLIGDAATSGGLTHGVNGNIVGNAGSGTIVLTTVIGALANNGGVTNTHALVASGPAVEAGSNANLPADTFDLDGDANTAETLPVDQRGSGFPRIADSADADTTATVDIGAYELHPTIENIGDQTTAEDTGFNFNFNIGDDTGALISTVTATSGNTTLVTDANLVVTGSGGTRNLAITPELNANTPADGTATITVTVTATNGQTAQDTFVLTVTDVNDAPAAVNDSISSIAEDSGTRIIPFADLTANDSTGPANESGQTLIVKTVSNPVGGTVAINGSNVEFTPTADFNGAASFDYTVEDNGTTNGSAAPQTSGAATVSFTVTEVNDAPTAVADSLLSVAEDSGTRIIPFADLTANDNEGPANESAQNLIVKTVTNPVGGTVLINGTNVEFTPTADFHGAASFDYTVEDDGTTNGVPDPLTSAAAATASFTIDGVADTPSVTDATTSINTQTTSGLVISRNAADGAEVTHFKITTITNGTLFQNDGITQINDNDFITFAQGNAGLKFTPNAGLSSPAFMFKFDVQASTSAVDGGLGGGVVTATITVNPSLGLIVNTLGDAADLTLDGVCDTDAAPGDQCTLRAAIQETNNAGSADTIGFSLAADSTIELTGALPAIAGDLEINGPTNGLTIDGNSTGRVFEVTSGTVSIDPLTVTGGLVNGGHGAGLLVTGGDVTVKDLLFTANTVVNGNGGAIAVTGGFLTILNTTISGNTATSAGGVYLGGGGLTMINVTVTNNTANGDTGSGPTATGDGGGLAVGANPSFIRNSIIAGNTATTNANVSGSIGLGGNNLIAGDPLLAPLANNGGPTMTHALLAGSPALDAGDNTQATNAGLVNDQRGAGFTRIADGPDGDTTATVDIGAFEAQVWVEDIADRAIDEDTTDSFSFNVGGAAAITNVTATSSNTALVPNSTANLDVTGAGGTRTLTITPVVNGFGSTTITVTVESASGSMSDTFLFTVNPVNDPPVFTGGPNVVVGEDAGAQTIPNWATGISPGPANESTQTLTFLVSNSNNSLFSVQPAIATNGTLTFTPAANASGVATVFVQLQDNGGGTDTFPIPPLQFTITVNAVNDAPTANGQSVNTNEDTPLGITLTGSDTETPSGSLIFTVTDQPDNGVLSGTGANLTYTPNANFNGADSFKFTVTDTGDGSSPALTSAEATVSITVNAVNDAPTANGQSVNTNEDTPLPITLTGSDVETAPGSLIFNVTVQPTNGVLSGTGANLTYTPNANFNGADSFKFTVTDTGDGSSPALTSAEATVNITVNAVNDGPVNTVPGAQSVTENGTLTFSAGNGNQISIADVDAGAPGVQVTLTATNGTVTLSGTAGLAFTVGDGTADATMTFTGTVASINTALNGLVFTPTSGFDGAASLQIVTNDLGNTGSGGALSDTDTINITVNAGGTLQFSSATYSVNENAGTATITVNRTGGTAGTTTVDFATSNGTADGTDYTTSTGTLTFNNGVTSQSFTVPILNDGVNEPDETVNLTLSNVTGSGQLGTPSTAVLTITDNDTGFGLSASSYTVGEGDVNLAITVNRLGDATLPASVEYSTTDLSAGLRCEQFNGVASERCDYSARIGVLTFAAGQSSATINIPVIDDVHVEGPETFSITLSNPIGAVLGTPLTAGITITDNDTVFTQANPIDTFPFYVRMQYLDFLEREPDAVGFAYWLDRLNTCSANPQCSLVQERIQVSAGFFYSNEFLLRKGYFIYRFYRASLGRAPTYHEFVKDMAAIGAVDADEDARRAAFTLNWVTRPDFMAIYNGLSDADFVDQLVDTADVNLDRPALVAELQGGKSRAQLVRDVAENVLVYDKYFREAFVTTQYFGYLKRDPDAIGFAYWMDRVNLHPNDFRLEQHPEVVYEVVGGFVYSEEYQLRFGNRNY